MKIISVQTDLPDYQRIFKLLQQGQPIVVWQVSDDGKREIIDSKLESYKVDTKKLRFIIQSENKLKKKGLVYCYCEDQQIIFKTVVEELKDTHFIGPYPGEIRLLDEAEVVDMKDRIITIWKTKRLSNEREDLGKDYMKVKSMAQRSTRDQTHLNQEFGNSADAEDRFFADKRESPRAKPKGEKWVKVSRMDETEGELFKLTDLSRGGLGFLVFNEEQFHKNQSIKIVGFEDFNLDDPIFGKVMSVRAVNDSENEFKVGIKFDEGQA